MDQGTTLGPNANPYVPYPAVITRVTRETEASDVKTFRVELCCASARDGFRYLPGQFAEVSVFGVGEAPISITSSPTDRGYLEFSVKRMGQVTTALHYLSEGAVIGVRGPYGNTFPIADMKGRDLIFIGGGIGLAPLRSLINYVLSDELRREFGRVRIIYGARSSGDLVFKAELERWGMRDDVDQVVTIDRHEDGWTGRVGFVPAVLKEVAPRPDRAVAITCGPPVMIKFVLATLTDLGFEPDQVITTLEMRMKCGIGKCGRCNIGSKYVCRDGPVFTYRQLLEMPPEY
ncbi:MAG: FAD/NAD(P)-binding protein [Firmicutes bacterium]|jgi:NAD(P)H-flavin reductase|nr:FAD/NAD(P)-binding protein [Bacillota bacterium]MDH7496807.1 FAD/NAD(P)-binding protein [Bacillota bacterium]